MKLLLLVCILIPCNIIFAQPGTLDNTFGANGKITQNLSAPQVTVVDMVLQADGKIVVLAKADYNHRTRAVLLRYNTNGTLDNSFDGDGVVTTQLGPSITYTDDPMAIKLQTDGKILICGLSYEFISEAVVVRYNTNGSLDGSFGAGGIVYVSDQGVNKITDMAVLANGDIFLLTTSSDFFRYLVLIKLNINGSHNAGFGTGGVVKLTVNNNYEPDFTQLEIQTDGKFVVAGTPFRFPGPGDPNFLLVRININGTLDNTFGTGGAMEADAGTAERDNLADVALQSDGKIIATGVGYDANHLTYTYAMRATSTGIPDNSFGVGGWQFIDAATTGFGSFGQVALQSDGKAIIGGFARNAQGNFTMAAARLTTAGILDNTFDSDGISLIQVNNSNSYGYIPVQQADGKVVLAGIAGNGTILSASIGRLSILGQTDNTISAGSTAITYLGSGGDYDIGEKVLLQTDQQILHIRKRKNGFLPDITITRHNPNGSFDNTYGTGGRVSVDLSGEYSYLNASVLANNKVLMVCGLQEILKGYQIAVVRLNETGNLDSTFGINGKFLLNTHVNTMVESVLQSAQILPDGKIMLLASETRGSSDADTSLLVRLNADGSYDNTFAGTGKIRLSDTARYDKISVQTDGKILLTFASKEYGYNSTTLIIRYNSNGSIDNTFNGGQALASGTNQPLMTVQANGAIVLSDMDGNISRLNSNGTFDHTFDTDGMAQLNYHFNILTDIKIQSDGKYLLGGNVYSDAFDSLNFQAVCIKPNGTLDSTFGSNGIVWVNVVYDNQNNAESMALQANGKILMSGYTVYRNTYNVDFASIRLNGDNASNTTYTFVGSGSWTAATNWSNNAIPPAILPAGSSIIIDPVPTGVCILNVTQHISSAASLTVKAGKSFIILGDLVLQ